ncbi:permease [Thomasclavelia cocleata]|uniref:Putative two-component membrane permease complex subunit SMU_747c n=1 Tax=Thomasclavelia cocleata TaxID=69824 RepID=A0A829Z9F2_9FIRM|nr:permease [Thomasclavelia cocleata]GFI40579.1 putative two-component membrane permease complex subunit SMU_747c [Thomasclavelia cocleata]
MEQLWLFIQNQVLGMKWLNDLIGTVLMSLGFDITSHIGGSIQFFIYDVLKITYLLCLLIFIISYIQSYFPPERSKKILGKFHGITANIVSALLGTVTPFCSCSSIPLFIGFTSAGLPLGVTFSFLISSPMVDLGSLVLLMSVFGVRIAIAYVIIGLVIAVVGGTIIEKLHMEKYVESFIMNASAVDINSPALTYKERMIYAKDQVAETLKKVFLYILIGVGIGAVIHNWIPEIWIESVLGGNNPFGVILATIVGIPMYADIFGTIPVAEALLAKGALLGTVLSFMMGVTTLSLPSMIMLKKAIKPQLLGLFIGICTVGIVLVGYLFNIFSFLLI